MTGIREQCPCGAKIRVKHPDPAPIAAQWRASHPCDRRAATDRDITAGAAAEVAYTEPHRTDSRVRGFGRADDTQPLPIPPATRRDLREAL